MLENETRYLLASIGLLVGSFVFFGASFRRRAFPQWPKGAEMQVVDWILLMAGICTCLFAAFGILGTLDDPAADRNWPSSLRGTLISALLLTSWGFLFRSRRKRAEISMAK